MTYYAARGAALDRFLTEYEIDPDLILSVSLDRYGEGADIRVHVYDRIDGLTYMPVKDAPGHYYADAHREDLTIRITYVNGEAAA